MATPFSTHIRKQFTAAIANCPPAPKAEVCPNPEDNAIAAAGKLTASEWAKQYLGFNAQGVQKKILDHDSHRLVLCCPRQWGKSTVVAIKALHYALARPNSEILVLSASEFHAGIVVEKINLYAATIGIKRRRARGRQFSVTLPTGSQVYAVAHTERAGCGLTANIVIVDEAALVSDTVLGYVTPTLTRTGGKLWLLSTPRGESGLFYTIWHDTQSPQWYRVRATIEDTPYADPNFIKEQQRLFPHTFRQDYYCEFTPRAGRLLSRERIAKMVDPALEARTFPDLV